MKRELKIESDTTIKKMIDHETVTKAVEEIKLIRKSLESIFYLSPSSEDAKTYLEMCIEELNMHHEQILDNFKKIK